MTMIFLNQARSGIREVVAVVMVLKVNYQQCSSLFSDENDDHWTNEHQ